MKIGAHVSIAEGIPNAPQRAADLGCEVFQIFSRSPRGGNPPAITRDLAASFEAECIKRQQYNSYIHTPYFINFASRSNRIHHGSISVIRQELERASQLGAKAVMTHLGSAKDYTPDKAKHKTAVGIARVLSEYKGKTKLLLELSAGAGAVIGANFEDMAAIIKEAEKLLKKRNIIGVCWDTAHLFATGYDLRDKKAVDAVVKEFDKIVGLKRLGLIHANDSKVGLGEKRDRHAHLGEGKIGLAGFEALAKHPKLKNVDMIVETPTLAGMKKDVVLLKKLRG